MIIRADIFLHNQHWVSLTQICLGKRQKLKGKHGLQRAIFPIYATLRGSR